MKLKNIPLSVDVLTAAILSSSEYKSDSFDNLSSDNEVPSTKLLSNYLTNLSISKATDSKLGGFTTGYKTDESNKTYAVQLSNTSAYVSVNWENTTDENVVNSLINSKSFRDESTPVTSELSALKIEKMKLCKFKATYDQEGSGSGEKYFYVILSA